MRRRPGNSLLSCALSGATSYSPFAFLCMKEVPGLLGGDELEPVNSINLGIRERKYINILRSDLLDP